MNEEYTNFTREAVKLPEDSNWPWPRTDVSYKESLQRAVEQDLFPGCPEGYGQSYLTPGIGELAYIHWFSMMNLWMDCFIVVPAAQENEARLAVEDAIDLWFDDDCELGEHELYADTGVCYGEMIEWVLYDRGITAYAIIFGDESPDGLDCSNEWNEWTESDWAHRKSL